MKERYPCGMCCATVNFGIGWEHQSLEKLIYGGHSKFGPHIEAAHRECAEVITMVVFERLRGLQGEWDEESGIFRITVSNDPFL